MPTRRLILGATAAAAAAPATAQTSVAVSGAFACLYVTDAADIAAWHAAMFGYELVSVGAPEQGPVAAFALLRRQGAILEIIQPREPRAPAPTGRPTYEAWPLGAVKVGLIVSDIEALQAQLKAKGATFNHEIVRSPQLGKRTFAVRDPEGNTVQAFEA